MTVTQAQQKHAKRKGSLVTRSRKFVFDSVAKLQLRRNPELWEHLFQVEAVTASTGCDFREYWWLYNYVTSHRPRYILECGAGISTIVMGFAIKELERQGHPRLTLVSLEDVPFYYDDLVKLIPAAVEPYVNIILSEVEDKDFGIGMGRSYANVPDHPYEFVFTDGPNLPRGTQLPYFDCDYINIVRRQERPVVGAVDGRKSTCAAYRELFPTAKQRKMHNVGFYYIEASAADFSDRT